MIKTTEAKSFLADNIERLLAERGRSAYWLMREIGMTEGGFYPIVRGEVVPSVVIAHRIAEVLKVTVDDLLKKSSEKSPKPVKSS